MVYEHPCTASVSAWYLGNAKQHIFQRFWRSMWVEIRSDKDMWMKKKKMSMCHSSVLRAESICFCYVFFCLYHVRLSYQSGFEKGISGFWCVYGATLVYMLFSRTDKCGWIIKWYSKAFRKDFLFPHHSQTGRPFHTAIVVISDALQIFDWFG